MAMNDGWGQPAGLDPPEFEQILFSRDCNPAIGELVLRCAVARLFAPGGRDGPFACNANLELVNGGRRVVVRVVKAASGQETRLVEGWREICDDFDLMNGDVAVFSRSPGGTFLARFHDPNGNARLSRFCSASPPSSPEVQAFYPGPRPCPGAWAPVKKVWMPAQGAQACGCEQAAGAGGGGGVDPALQGDDMTIRKAIDLAVQCGAREGSDEHYMATKLFVKAENRAMFLTFRTNAGRLQWLRRCYEDRMN